jgi:hypothetical protein
MFTIPRLNVIESDEGFSVEVVTPTQVNYAEGNNILLIDSEYLDGPAGLVIYKRSIKKWDSGLKVDETERARIVDNVRRAFRHRGIEIEVL